MAIFSDLLDVRRNGLMPAFVRTIDIDDGFCFPLRYRTYGPP